jgi:acetolactate synthase-1/2/3 large subunit
MNGAQALMKTLVDAGIEVCFTNPGTSEMHFVAALDSEPRMRAVLALFEGVATGAADGYARMADKPAATLLHLGCGLGNGLANLHNARKGKVPVVNIVGDHATTHTQYDAQLQSDIETVARNVSPGFVRTSRDTTQLCQDAVDAIAAARGLPGQVATLILPADVSWGDGGVPACARVAADTCVARRMPVVDKHRQAIRNPGASAPCCWATGRCASRACWRPRASPRMPASSCCRSLPHPTGARRRPARRGARCLPGRNGQRATGRPRPPGAGGCQGARVLLRLSGQERATWCPTAAQCIRLPRPTQDAAASLERLATAVGAAQAPAGNCSRPSPPGRPRGNAHRAEKVCKAVGHLLPTTPSSSTRPSPRG